jgi:hypothetical protein
MKSESCAENLENWQFLVILKRKGICDINFGEPPPRKAHFVPPVDAWAGLPQRGTATRLVTPPAGPALHAPIVRFKAGRRAVIVLRQLDLEETLWRSQAVGEGEMSVHIEDVRRNPGPTGSRQGQIGRGQHIVRVASHTI